MNTGRRVFSFDTQFKEESLTGFQVGPMLQYQTGFHGIALDFSLLYVERGIKLTQNSCRQSRNLRNDRRSGGRCKICRMQNIRRTSCVYL